MNKLFKICKEIYTSGFFIRLCRVTVILIGLFSGIASYLIISGLSFIGLSDFRIYIGAVLIVFLFILMLIAKGGKNNTIKEGPGGFERNYRVIIPSSSLMARRYYSSKPAVQQSEKHVNP